MSTVTIVLLVILVILIAALIGLYFFGKKAQKKQEEQQEKIDEKKEEKQQQEKMIEGSVEADRLEADVTVDQTGTSKLEEAQQHIQTILKKNNLVNEDLKGIKIDLNF